MNSMQPPHRVRRPLSHKTGTLSKPALSPRMLPVFRMWPEERGEYGNSCLCRHEADAAPAPAPHRGWSPVWTRPQRPQRPSRTPGPAPPLHLLLELLHQPVLLSLQGSHLLLRLLLGGRQLQQGDVGILLADGGQQSLLPAREGTRFILHSPCRSCCHHPVL